MSVDIDYGLSDFAELAADSPGAAAWSTLLTAVDRSVAKYQRLVELQAEFRARGVELELGARGRAWLDAVDKLVDSIVAIIVQNPVVQTAIDAATAVSELFSSPSSALSGLDAAGAWMTLVQRLKPSMSLQGLGNPLVVAGRAAWTVLSKPSVWVAAKDVLLKVTPWVASVLVTDNVQKAIQGNAESAEAKGNAVMHCLEAARTISDPTAQREAIAHCGQEPSSLLWLALGCAAGIGGLLYMQSRKPAGGIYG